MRPVLAAVVLLLAGCDLVVDPPPIVPPPVPDAADVQDAKPDVAVFVDAPMADLNPQVYDPVPGEMLIGNTTGATLLVRVRGLRPSVQLDCAAVAKAPGAMLARALFAPATTWILESGRAIGVGGSGRPCTALLVDGSGLSMRLLFWQQGQHPSALLPSTVAGAPAGHLLQLVTGEGEVELAPAAEVLAPPPAFAPGPPPGCGQPDPAGDLAWSTPVPVGDQTILELAKAPDGCMQLSLLGKLGVQPWTLCLPPGAFPFAEGDSFFAAPLTGGHNVQPVAGYELLGETQKVRFGLGEDLVYFGPGTLAIEPLPGCAGGHDACGTLHAPLQARITRPGEPDAVVYAGQGLDLGAGRQLHLLRASAMPVADLACVPGGKVAGRQVQSVFVEVKP